MGANKKVNESIIDNAIFRHKRKVYVNISIANVKLWKGKPIGDITTILKSYRRACKDKFNEKPKRKVKVYLINALSNEMYSLLICKLMLLSLIN